MDYNSIDEVLEHLEQDRPGDSGSNSTDDEPTESWDLSLGWQGAMDAYCGGWAEGAQRAYELAERLVPRPIDKRTTLRRNVAGAFPNVGAYLAGAPNAMFQVSKKTVTGRPYVHLYVPISYGAMVDANTAFDRGCALVAVIDALEVAGCRVKVTLTRTSMMTEKTRLCMRFLVKDYGDNLDIDQLIFTAAHPAMFRRICFALQERSRHAVVRNKTNGSYGTPTDLLDEDTEPDGNVTLVMFPRLLRGSGSTPDTPETFLAQMVGALPEEIRTEIQPKGRG
jgi:hypothetical protein